ncbi:UNVERIFIED_CONTAM: hypothetical protein Sradi_5870400 [Sesamum radiatum]|uniref:SWIM-type domain-containing protein n=1 Tax=Sesamum radiatum TaxID=300843 RepID=A0AAW2KU84_SESRA
MFLNVLEGDNGIRELLRDYKDNNVISIYFQDKVSPLLSVDVDGNILHVNDSVPQLEYIPHGEANSIDETGAAWNFMGKVQEMTDGVYMGEGEGDDGDDGTKGVVGIEEVFMGEGEGDNGNERVDRNEGEGVVGTEEVFMGEGEGDAGTEEVDVDVGAGEGVDGLRKSMWVRLMGMIGMREWMMRMKRKESRNCFPSWAGEDKYEVMHFMQNHIVYLKNRFCSCGIFQLVGYLCCHAIATVDYHRFEVEDYIDDYFSKAVYMKVYSHMVNSVPEMHDNEDSGMGKVDLPNVIIKFGRPRKSRRRDANDVMDTATTSRKESKPRQTEMQHLTCCIRFKRGQTKIKTSPTFVPAAYAASNLNPTLEQTRPAPVPAASAASMNQTVEQPPLSKAARKQQRPISTSSKLAKRKQVKAPSQPTTF